MILPLPLLVTTVILLIHAKIAATLQTLTWTARYNTTTPPVADDPALTAQQAIPIPLQITTQPLVLCHDHRHLKRRARFAIAACRWALHLHFLHLPIQVQEGNHLHHQHHNGALSSLLYRHRILSYFPVNLLSLLPLLVSEAKARTTITT